MLKSEHFRLIYTLFDYCTVNPRCNDRKLKIGSTEAKLTSFSSWLRAQKSSPLIPQVDNAQQDIEMRVKNSEEA